jgi:hypothetical protein
MTEPLDNVTLLKAIRHLYVSDLFTGNVDAVQEQLIFLILEEKTIRLWEVSEYLTPNLRKKFEFEIDTSKFDLL